MLSNPSGNRLTMNTKQPTQPSQADAFLVGSQDEGLLLFFASRLDSKTRYALHSLQ